MSDDTIWQASLNVKDPSNLEELASIAAGDPAALRIILDGLTAKANIYRENCFKLLLQICDITPEVLYPQWDYFVELLDSRNAFQRAIGLQLLARLTRIDSDQHFEALFDRYFALLDDDKVMVSRYLVQNVWRIVACKPHLMVEITEQLLRIDETHHPEGRMALLKADILDAIETYYAQIENKEPVLALAESAKLSSSPKARQRAREFLLTYREE
ncbi:MAG: hypothetical protein JW981_04610 [Anaerolineae bacterium]|nr:hypothetical protein [Anaerolineae bacterium]